MRLLFAYITIFIGFRVHAQNLDTDQLFQLGKDSYEQNDFTTAIQHYEAALKLTPESQIVRFELVLCYMETSQFTEAILHASKIIRSGELQAKDAYFIKAKALYYKQQYKKAIKTCKAAIRDFPSEQLFYYNLGLYEHETNLYIEAEKHLIQAIELDRTHASSHLLLAYNSMAQKERIKAMLSLYYFLILENNGDRAASALRLLQELQHNNVSQENYSTIMSENNSAEHNEFQVIDILLSFLYRTQEENLSLESSSQAFVISNEIFFGTLTEGMNAHLGFWESSYIFFFRTLYLQNHTEALSYHISQTRQDPSVAQWISENTNKLKAFYHWLEDQS